MKTTTHIHHGYELGLHRKSDDRYQVTIFDPNGKRIASTGIHLERQGTLTEASRYVDHPSRATTSHMTPLSGEGVLIPAFSFPGFDSIPAVILAKHRPKFPTALRALLAKPLLKQDR